MKIEIYINDRLAGFIGYIFSGKRLIAAIAILMMASSAITYSAVGVDIPHTFSKDQVISSSLMNENFQALKTKIEELEASINIAPTGSIIAYGGTTAPPGWLLCDGASYLISEYPELHAVIGSAFGTIDSNNLFNVPDLQGKFLRGNNNTDFDRIQLNDGGNSTGIGSYQDDEYGQHRHLENHPTEKSSVIIGDYVLRSATGRATSGWTSGQVPYTGYTEYKGGDETRPKNVAVNYIIKY